MARNALITSLLICGFVVAASTGVHAAGRAEFTTPGKGGWEGSAHLASIARWPWWSNRPSAAPKPRTSSASGSAAKPGCTHLMQMAAALVGLGTSRPTDEVSAGGAGSEAAGRHRGDAAGERGEGKGVLACSSEVYRYRIGEGREQEAGVKLCDELPGSVFDVDEEEEEEEGGAVMAVSRKMLGAAAGSGDGDGMQSSAVEGNMHGYTQLEGARLHLIFLGEDVNPKDLYDTSSKVGDLMFFASRYHKSHVFEIVKRSSPKGDALLQGALVVRSFKPPRQPGSDPSDGTRTISEGQLRRLLDFIVKQELLSYQDANDVFAFILPPHVQLANADGMATCSELCTYHGTSTLAAATCRSKKQRVPVAARRSVQFVAVADPTGCAKPSACTDSGAASCLANNAGGNAVANLLHQQVSELYSTPSGQPVPGVSVRGREGLRASAFGNGCAWNFGLPPFRHSSDEDEAGCWNEEVEGRKYLLQAVWDPETESCVV